MEQFIRRPRSLSSLGTRIRRRLAIREVTSGHGATCVRCLRTHQRAGFWSTASRSGARNTTHRNGSAPDRLATCASFGGRDIDTVITTFNLGTRFASEIAGSTNTFVLESPGSRYFTAAITPGDLQNAIKEDQSVCGRPLSTDPTQYALIGVEHGLEGWREISELAGSTSNLQLRTEYTPRPPEATTSEASNIQEEGAMLKGSVNPKASDTHYYFQYGETTAYGATTPEGDAGSGVGSVPETATITGLQPGRTYHYRLVATSSGGTVPGGDRTLRTTVAPSMVVANGGVSAVTEGVSNGLFMTTSDFVQNTWRSSLLEPNATTYSGAATAADSSGNIWTAFEGAGNALWVGLDSASGGWGMSYEGSPGTTYSAPSIVLTGGKVWVAAEGPSHTLNLAEWSAGKWTSSTPVTGSDVYSAPSVVADSSGDVWVSFEGPGNQLWVGLETAGGTWGMSYEGPSSTTYTAPSIVVAGSNLWVAAEGPSHTLNLAEWSAGKWTTSTPVSGSDVYSAPSAAVDSGGDVWVSFEGPGNQLWVGVETPGGTWGMSYEGPSGTTYSAPSEVIDSAGNIWVGAQGPENMLKVTGRLAATGSWVGSFEGLPNAASVSSAPSMVVANGGVSAVTEGVSNGLFMTTSDFVQNTWRSSLLEPNATTYSGAATAADSSGNIWTAFEGAGNALWVGLDSASGGWGMSYEGSPGTTYSAPSIVLTGGKVWVAAEGPSHTLNLAEWSAGKWTSSTPVTGSDVYSAPSVVADSSGDVWVSFEGPGNQLWVGLETAGGTWGMSYEGPSSTTYTAPSIVVAGSNLWVAAEGPSHTLNLAEWSAGKWTTSTPVSGSDVYSAPSAAVDSGGDVWVSFEGPGNQLWVGVETPGGTWGMSYEGPSGTTYSAPSEVIDSAGNIWVGAQGPENMLKVTGRLAATGSWVGSFEGG